MGVQDNCEPELSNILAKLFNMYLKEYWSADDGKVSSVVVVYKNVGERSTVKNYYLVRRLSAVNEIFEKLVNNNFFMSSLAKTNQSVFSRNKSFKILGLSLSFKLHWGSYIVSVAITT